jgi:hypothetical protein
VQHVATLTKYFKDDFSSLGYERRMILSRKKTGRAARNHPNKILKDE